MMKPMVITTNDDDDDDAYTEAQELDSRQLTPKLLATQSEKYNTKRFQRNFDYNMFNQAKSQIVKNLLIVKIVNI